LVMQIPPLIAPLEWQKRKNLATATPKYRCHAINAQQHDAGFVLWNRAVSRA
jgi:hypothetical protein